ncbi:MAG: hypothetical protein JNL01_14375 [Bdellovibrionales bacterium]|nr:hypothetical protein [Bdellovibrionales bacterium]
MPSWQITRQQLIGTWNSAAGSTRYFTIRENYRGELEARATTLDTNVLVIFQNEGTFRSGNYVWSLRPAGYNCLDVSWQNRSTGQWTPNGDMICKEGTHSPQDISLLQGKWISARGSLRTVDFTVDYRNQLKGRFGTSESNFTFLNQGQGKFQSGQYRLTYQLIGYTGQCLNLSWENISTGARTHYGDVLCKEGSGDQYSKQLLIGTWRSARGSNREIRISQDYKNQLLGRFGNGDRTATFLTDNYLMFRSSGYVVRLDLIGGECANMSWKNVSTGSETINGDVVCRTSTSTY